MLSVGQYLWTFFSPIRYDSLILFPHVILELLTFLKDCMPKDNVIPLRRPEAKQGEASKPSASMGKLVRKYDFSAYAVEDLEQVQAESSPNLPEIVRIGGLVPKNHSGGTPDIKPALIPLVAGNGLCFLSASPFKAELLGCMELLALRLLLALPAKRLQITLIQGSGVGDAFAHLTQLPSSLVGNKVLSEPQEIRQALLELKQSASTIQQKYLGHQYEDLDAYNQQAGELAEPFRFVFLSDFPQGFTKESFELLLSLLPNQKRVGIYFFMTLDTETKPATGVVPQALFQLLPVIFKDGKTYQVRNLPGVELFQQYQLLLDFLFPRNLENLLQKIRKNAELTTEIKVLQSELLPNLMWRESTRDGIRIPIGKVGIVQTQYFTLSHEPVHHALIGGKTGSGKTILLHNLITTGAYLYSPEELRFFLLDYKEGTEFKVYEHLPHMKALSVESDEEFGLRALESLQQEVERRGALLKKQNVSSVKEYRQKTGAVIPRILVIIDEFQVLLSPKTNALMEDLVKRGRSFGIHLVLSTQNLASSNNSQLSAAVLSELGLRIALMMTAGNSSAFLSQTNMAASRLTSIGQAIYNTQNGHPEGNSEYQTAYLSREEIEGWVETFRQEAQEKLDPSFQSEHRFIYDGSQQGRMENNRPVWECLKNNQWTLATAYCPVFVGEPAFLREEHVSYPIGAQYGSNLLMVGTAVEDALSILYWSVVQLLPQSSPESRVYLVDLFPLNSPYRGKLQKFLGNLPNLEFLNTKADFERVVQTLSQELGNPPSETPGPAPRKVLCIFPLEGGRQYLAKPNAMSLSEPVKKLSQLVKEGPEKNLHVLLYSQRFALMNEILDSKTLNDFDNKIVLQGEDSHKILGTGGNSPALKAGTALLKASGTQYELDKFRVYALPEEVE
ncbi:MAG: DNA translocase FtsK [SAR324 cluster bacterium]|nr:DNA translocase FtsK [SAR324 cluster bacterium]